MHMIKNLHHDVEKIIKKAGQIQLSYFKKALSLDRREKNGAGFVTQADLETEKFLIQELGKLMPGADFYAEESGVSGNGEYRWVIDPLDGTTNFAHGLPHFCISIALTHNDDVIFGMIYQPVLNELFWAEKGQGAWLNGTKIAVSSQDSLSKSFLVIVIPYSGFKQGEEFARLLWSIVPGAYSFRYLGAAALDLAYVACGRFDGICFAGLAWWDFAAGQLLIKEAGGCVTDFNKNGISITSQSCVAGGAVVHEALAKLLFQRLSI
jgi:myo-inositol-1(or 4)-monophosphatase